MVTGCLVKETLKAGSSLRGDGYILLRMKKPAPQQNNTPIISSTLREKQQTPFYQPLTHLFNLTGPDSREERKDDGRKDQVLVWVSTGLMSFFLSATQQADTVQSQQSPSDIKQLHCLQRSIVPPPSVNSSSHKNMQFNNICADTKHFSIG